MTSVRHSTPSFVYTRPGGFVKSTVDYIMVRQQDKAKVRNVKVISSEECVHTIYRSVVIAKLLSSSAWEGFVNATERQDITGLNCIKGASGKVIIDDKGIKDSWKEYMEKLMNEENEWDHTISIG